MFCVLYGGKLWWHFSCTGLDTLHEDLDIFLYLTLSEHRCFILIFFVNFDVQKWHCVVNIHLQSKSFEKQFIFTLPAWQKTLVRKTEPYLAAWQKTLIRKTEKENEKIANTESSLVYNTTCLKENLLPTYTNIYIYICIYNNSIGLLD